MVRFVRAERVVCEVLGGEGGVFELEGGGGTGYFPGTRFEADAAVAFAGGLGGEV